MTGAVGGAAGGAIDDVTHINYAFGNVTSDLVCDIADGRHPVAEVRARVA